MADEPEIKRPISSKSLFGLLSFHKMKHNIDLEKVMPVQYELQQMPW